MAGICTGRDMRSLFRFHAVDENVQDQKNTRMMNSVGFPWIFLLLVFSRPCVFFTDIRYAACLLVPCSVFMTFNLYSDRLAANVCIIACFLGLLA